MQQEGVCQCCDNPLKTFLDPFAGPARVSLQAILHVQCYKGCRRMQIKVCLAGQHNVGTDQSIGQKTLAMM